VHSMHVHNLWQWRAEESAGAFATLCALNDTECMHWLWLQVKECLTAARVGKPYTAANGDSSPGSRSADAGGNADSRAQEEQQQQQQQQQGAASKLQLGAGGIEGGSDSVSRRLRERTVSVTANALAIQYRVDTMPLIQVPAVSSASFDY
jgi:hypothetical protein